MSRARAVALAAVLLALGIAAVALGQRSRPPAERGDRPTLLYLSSLPILFGEEFSLDGTGSPVLADLRSRYRLVPIDVTDPQSLSKGRLLLMAQPRAQPPENLVALDDWVRAGGRLLLLADPMLEWPSKKPLGDPTRPPRMFADTGLLGHWGLRLDAPDERGPVSQRIAGHRVTTVSPGSLHGGCRIEDGGLVADCTIGRGRAIIVADADFLNFGADDVEAGDNLSALDSLLGALQR